MGWNLKLRKMLLGSLSCWWRRKLAILSMLGDWPGFYSFWAMAMLLLCKTFSVMTCQITRPTKRQSQPTKYLFLNTEIFEVWLIHLKTKQIFINRAPWRISMARTCLIILLERTFHEISILLLIINPNKPPKWYLHLKTKLIIFKSQ